MSVKPLDPGELKTRVQFGYIESGEGEMGEPLPGKFIAAGKAWVKSGADLAPENPHSRSGPRSRNMAVHDIPQGRCCRRLEGNCQRHQLYSAHR